ncbi:NACHT domain-containing protein [Kitasatospora cineracea]|uniref:NACHT domain-containing protein n=1 Tax=Kitasatospora cineracea TaxID=88074 RepID=UPI00341EAA5C
MPPLPHRVAAVRSHGQASGCLLTPRLVLTVAHVLDPFAGPGSPPPEAAVLGGTGWSACTTVWQSARLDAALLLADHDLVPGPLTPLRWGATSALTPVAGVHLTGFPAVERDQDGRLDTAQALATLTPGAGLRTGRPALVLQQQPPKPAPGADSPWAGMSGAPVVYRDRLLGLAVRDRRPDAWSHSQLDLLPATALLASTGFRAALAAQLPELPCLEGISAEEIADADFERDYARALEADYGRLRIFGLRQADRRGWDLSTSYLSLEIRSPARPGAADLTAPGPQRADQVLRGRRRMLVRGQAGSGKTTLVQWLAVGAVNGTLDQDLAELNHRVPLVLQLRKLHRKGVMRPRPEEFLALDDRMCADRQPPGWAHRLLTAGRALLLIDGLDEVPDEQRDEVRGWLEQLLDLYPDTLALATVRPSAVPPGWLDHLGFDELLLCPMGRQDRRRFVERWHRAALRELLAAPHTDAQEHRWRSEVEQDRADLLRTFDTVPEIAQLTDSPLLCAMICALNRESDGALPRNRMTLYRDALAMLLVKRDEGRKVNAAERLQASEEEQLALLRRVAHWLVRNNQVEGRRRDALAQLTKALRDLPALARRTDPEQAYLHLLNRTGLLTETGPDTFQFVHRTFQDYLAAMEFREEHDFGLLAGHAADEQWSDVIRLTVGHCGRRERAELLAKLLATGDTAPPELAPDIHLLAATCLPNAPELDTETRTTVLHRLREQLPRLLARRPDASRLAAVGEELVPLLREFAERDPAAVEAVGPLVPDVLGQVGGEEALALLGDLAARGGREAFRLHVMLQWRKFDPVGFTRQVTRRADLRSIQVVLEFPEQIDELAGHPTLHHVWLGGPSMPVDPSHWGRLADRVDNLVLSTLPGLSDLSFVPQWPRLRRLYLYFCPDLDDLTPLSGLALHALGVRSVLAERRAEELFALVRGLPGLRELSLNALDLSVLADREPLAGIRLLVLLDVPSGYPLAELRPLFPALRELVLYTTDGCASLDLAPFAGDRRCRLHVNTSALSTRLLGQDLFAPEQLTVTARAPS